MGERLIIGKSEVVSVVLDNGARITARKIETSRVTPGSVALHEARHVVASSSIKMATIIPSGDALGTTVPDNLTAAAAAAPAAFGDSGTGWDRFVTEHYLGVNWETAKSAARSELSGQGDLVHEVATTLEEKGTIGQQHVESAKKRIVKIRQGRIPVKIDIYGPGEQRVESFTTETFHGEVVINHQANLRAA